MTEKLARKWPDQAEAVSPSPSGSNSADVVAEKTSANSTPPTPQPVWPEDSILEDYVQIGRGIAECQDSLIIGSVLPVIAAFMDRRVFVQFGGRKYPNFIHVLTTKPGFRKTTVIGVAEQLARAVLPGSAFISGATSEQALFKSYQVRPDKLWIEDDGNTVLSNWASDSAGKLVSKRVLKLYDCAPWRQNYIRQGEEDGQADILIEETSTSILIGTTYNNCRFNGIDARDGLRRRVCYYISDSNARLITWPEPIDSAKFTALVTLCKKLLAIGGRIELSSDARSHWNEIQERNRAEIERIVGIDNASEAQGSMLAEAPSKILKTVDALPIVSVGEEREDAVERDRKGHVAAGRAARGLLSIRQPGIG